MSHMDKALRNENPPLPMDSQSGLFVVTFEPDLELSDAFKVFSQKPKDPNTTAG